LLCGSVGGPFEELAAREGGTGVHEGDQVWCVDRVSAFWAASMSLNAIASGDAGAVQTVANVDSIGFEGAQVHQHRSNSAIAASSLGNPTDALVSRVKFVIYREPPTASDHALRRHCAVLHGSGRVRHVAPGAVLAGRPH
jgi:hypothetical protein